MTLCLDQKLSVLLYTVVVKHCIVDSLFFLCLPPQSLYIKVYKLKNLYYLKNSEDFYS
jgi:hypothetical protein